MEQSELALIKHDVEKEIAAILAAHSKDGYEVLLGYGGTDVKIVKADPVDCWKASSIGPRQNGWKDRPNQLTNEEFCKVMRETAMKEASLFAGMQYPGLVDHFTAQPPPYPAQMAFEIEVDPYKKDLVAKALNLHMVGLLPTYQPTPEPVPTVWQRIKRFFANFVIKVKKLFEPEPCDCDCDCEDDCSYDALCAEVAKEVERLTEAGDSTESKMAETLTEAYSQLSPEELQAHHDAIAKLWPGK